MMLLGTVSLDLTGILGDEFALAVHDAPPPLDTDVVLAANSHQLLLLYDGDTKNVRLSLNSTATHSDLSLLKSLASLVYSHPAAFDVTKRDVAKLVQDSEMLDPPSSCFTLRFRCRLQQVRAQDTGARPRTVLLVQLGIHRDYWRLPHHCDPPCSSEYEPRSHFPCHCRELIASALANGIIPLDNYQLTSSLAPSTLASAKTDLPQQQLDAVRDLDALFRQIKPPANYPQATQPEAVLTPLRPYQRKALAWMLERERPIQSLITKEAAIDRDLAPYWRIFRRRHLPTVFLHASGRLAISPPTLQSCRGGILADEMGLGKTLEVIALLLSHPRVLTPDTPPIELPQSASEAPPRQLKLLKGTLIISPNAILSQWIGEITRHAPGALTYHVYRGIRSGVTVDDLANYDVVLTTYEILTGEGRTTLRNTRVRERERD